jgi:hypothetical protein
MPPSHARALADIASCRTPQMGGHLLECDDCGHRNVAVGEGEEVMGE